MKTAIGGLKWRPADFWDATLTEFFDGITGHNESNGAEEPDGPPSENEIATLIAKYG